MALFKLTKVFLMVLLIIIMPRCKLSHSILIFTELWKNILDNFQKELRFHLSFGRLHAQCRESEKADKVINIAI